MTQQIRQSLFLGKYLKVNVADSNARALRGRECNRLRASHARRRAQQLPPPADSPYPLSYKARSVRMCTRLPPMLIILSPLTQPAAVAERAVGKCGNGSRAEIFRSENKHSHKDKTDYEIHDRAGKHYYKTLPPRLVDKCIGIVRARPHPSSTQSRLSEADAENMPCRSSSRCG